MSTPIPEVVQTLEFSKNWHPLAVEKVRNFFDQRGQLRNAYRGAEGCWCLTVAFRDDAQAQAFMEALGRGELGRRFDGILGNGH